MAKIKSTRRIDVPVTDQVLAKAIERGTKRKDAGVRAAALRYLPPMKALLVLFADKSAVALPVRNYPELSVLSVAQLKRVSLGMGGSALCLEEEDLHVSIAGLVAASAPLRRMAITIAAVRNGRRTSASKALASRENGLKGGRPRKQLELETA
jgi:hypothetical protein